MSDERTSLVERGEEFLRVFQRGAEFTRELLRENERLQRTLDCLEDAQQTAARSPEDWDKLRVELLGRLASLEDENTGDRERLLSAEVESPGFAGRHLEIEEENNNLASLYVASYQLHSTLEINEVIRIVIEIVIDLIGAEIFAIYLPDAKIEMLEVVASEGVDAAEIPGCRIGSGVFGEAVAAKRTTCWGIEPSADYTKPMVCIPLVIEDRPIGAIAIFKLFQQKDGFSPLDHELFNLLGGHAATAIFAARLYSQSERKLNTIQGFIDLLTS